MELHPSVTNTRTINRFNRLEEDFRAIHGNKYDYSKVIYKSAQEKVLIICKVHGEFEQTPQGHLRNHGCPKCGTEAQTAAKVQKSKDTFVDKATAIHREQYDYSKVIYSKATEKIVIVCKIHGEFSQEPRAHLDGEGCPYCGTASQAEKR